MIPRLYNDTMIKHGYFDGENFGLLMTLVSPTVVVIHGFWFTIPWMQLLLTLLQLVCQSNGVIYSNIIINDYYEICLNLYRSIYRVFYALEHNSVFFLWRKDPMECKCYKSTHKGGPAEVSHMSLYVPFQFLFGLKHGVINLSKKCPLTFKYTGGERDVLKNRI